jgi:hypothetical protein
MVIEAGLSIATVAPPVAVPVQFTSDKAVTVYTVVDDGLTVRVAGLLLLVVITPSDQVTIQLGVPVNAA